MHHFSIRDIENLSGIKAHTLRIWEQRYGLTLCKRKESQHRFYDNDDLKNVLRIAHLYNNGYKISRIAKLSQEEVLELASKLNEKDRADVFINQMIEASMDFDENRFENIIHSAVVNMGMEQFMLKVAFEFMAKMGLLWMTNHIIPAHEHFSSYLIQKKLIAATDSLYSFPIKQSGCFFLVFTPEGEAHEIPILFAHYMLKKRGFRSVLMGKNVSVESIAFFCNKNDVTHLYFHLITNFTDSSISEYLHMLQKRFRSTKIIAAGPAFRDLNEMLPDEIRILASGEEIHTYLNTLSNTL